MAKASPRRHVTCYLCAHVSEVSTKTMSTTCPGCHRAIKIEDVVIKNYLPVTDLQTCGKITITRRGRVAARRIQSGEGIDCQGSMEGSVDTGGEVQLGPKASWKGERLRTPKLSISEGATLIGIITVPWHPTEDPAPPKRKTTARAEAARI